MGTKLLIAVFVALLLGAGWLGLTGWNLDTGVEMSGHGYAAMIIGVVMSLVVGIALMTLVFYSSRMGYDDAANHNAEKNDDERGHRA